MESHSELLENPIENKLNLIASSDLSVYFYESTPCSLIYDLCNCLTNAIDCINVQYFENDSNKRLFLQKTLPILIEVLIRRKSLRENELDILDVLVRLTIMLSNQWACEMVEMCELRNLIMLGNYTHEFVFINPKQVKLVGSGTANKIACGPCCGFYMDFGRPIQTAVKHNMSGLKWSCFWPENWHTVVGGRKAVGHYLKVLITPTHDLQSDISSIVSGWIMGRVIGFQQDLDLYEVLVTVDKSSVTGAVDCNSLPKESHVIKVSLATTRHFWMDVDFKQNIEADSTTQPQLTFTSADTGCFLRIFWSKYGKYYYARIVSFDTASGQHLVLYEDGDTRRYDMRVRHDFELVVPTTDILNEIESYKSSGDVKTVDLYAAKLVAEWHARLLTTQAKKSLAMSDDLTSSNISNEINMTKHGLLLHRPPANVVVTTESQHQIAIINSFVEHGGFDSMTCVLRSCGNIRAPLCRIISLHLQLVVQLMCTWRRSASVNMSGFLDLVWDAKETIPFTLLHLGENQVKDVQIRDFNEVCLALRDMVQQIFTSDNAKNVIVVKNDNDCMLHETIELLHLTMAKRLLSSHQLQKKYMGLSMIKDAIDSLYPKIAAFTVRRLQILSAQKSSGMSNNNNNQQRSAVFSYSYMSTASLDNWLLNNDVFRAIFGGSIHQDLAAKSELLLAYLAHRRLLTTKHLDQLWVGGLRGAHDSVVRVIHRLIVFIVPLLEPELRMYQFLLIASVPYTDYSENFLHLIKLFTVQALLANKEDLTKRSQSNLKEPVNEKKSSSTNSFNNTDDGVASAYRSSLPRKGLVMKAPQKQWLGFGLLWQYIQDPMTDANVSCRATHSDVELVMLASSLLVELLADQFADEREEVMQRCLDNIQHGVSITTSLQILSRVLLLFPTVNKRWFGNIVVRQPTVVKSMTVGMQIERLIKHHHLLETLFDDLARYHQSYTTGKVSLSEIASHEKLTPFISRRHDSVEAGHHFRSVSERLDFLKFVVLNSNTRLTQAQAVVLWQTFAENSGTPDALDCLCIWLDTLITQDCKPLLNLLNSLAHDSDPAAQSDHSKLAFLLSTADSPFSSSSSFTNESRESAFEEGVIVHLFETYILKWAVRHENTELLSRQSVARLLMKLFLLVNISNRSIRVEIDVPWTRTGQLQGLAMLWKLAVDVTDLHISVAAITLLVELHHRIPSKLKAGDTIKHAFLRQCFKQLYLSIQSLHEGDGSHSAALHGSSIAENSSQPADTVVLTSPSRVKFAPTWEDWFDDGPACVTLAMLSNRIICIVSTLHMFVYRFYMEPMPLCTVRVVSGREETMVCSLLVKSSETVGQLRSKISKHLKVSADCIIMVRILVVPDGSVNSSERMDNDERTLKAMKFNSYEKVLVRKITANSPVSPTLPGGTDVESSTVDASDVVSSHQIQKEIDDENPIKWLSAATNFCNAKHSVNMLNQLLPFIAASRMSALQNVDVNEDKLSESGGVQDSEFQENLQDSGVFHSLLVLLHHSPLYVDQLLEMLDGYLSTDSAMVDYGKVSRVDLSALVWDVLQMLPTQSTLLAVIRSFETEQDNRKLTHVYNSSCPYRLLYALQITESVLSGEQSTSQQQSGVWAANFFRLGGVDCVVALLAVEIFKVEKMLIDGTISKLSNENYNLNSSALFSDQHESSAHDGRHSMCRNDRPVITIALLWRILHRLLLLDDRYKIWLSDTTVDDQNGSNQTTLNISSGIVLSCLDIDLIVRNILECVSNGFRLWSIGLLSTAALQALSENGSVLIFGLVMASEDGLTVLRKQSYSMESWIAAACIQSQCAPARAAVSWRIYECCANIIKGCLPDSHSTVAAACSRRYRLALLEFLRIATSASCNVITPSDCGENIYTLIAGISDLCLRTDVNSLMQAEIIGDGESVQSNRELMYRSLVDTFVIRFVQHKSTESFHSSTYDGSLVGYLRILLVLARCEPALRTLLCHKQVFLTSNIDNNNRSTDLLGYLYAHCLFPSQGCSVNGTFAVSSCQTMQSRNLAFNLLIQLCDCHIVQLSRLLKMMQCSENIDDFHSCEFTCQSRYSSSFTRKFLQQWDYDPNLYAKESRSDVGLSNQGGTCYMNAFLQQLYHISSFTDGLLALNDSAAHENEHLTEHGENEKLLFQLQVMFGSMRLSQRRYYDTLPFCKAFIDYDGQPVNLSEQKDINEFASMLFDKLEHNKDCAALLASTLQGTLVWRTKSIESLYRSEREEPFYMISAEVKGNSSLEDALEMNMAEEFFTGDNKVEDADGRKIEALRRCAIRVLPSTLIIHLKRFEFDLESLHRRKVNDRMSFPQQLDMFPYTEACILAKECTESNQNERSAIALNETSRSEGGYKYVLKGVVAHVGAIDRGHYYSFIRNDGSGYWREYNDRSVLPFSPEALEHECFGGLDDNNNGTASPSGQHTVRIRENNAYLLVYQRCLSVSQTTPDIEPQHNFSSPLSVSLHLSANDEVESDKYPVSVDCGAGAGAGADDCAGAGNCDCDASPVSPTLKLLVNSPNNKKRRIGKLKRNSTMSTRVMASVLKLNIQFQIDRFQFDVTHISFLWKLINLQLNLASDPTQITSGNYVATNESHKSNNEEVLCSLVLTTLRFMFEVIVRARAKSCVLIFFNRLEELVLNDNSGRGAEAVVSELARLNVDNLSWLVPRSACVGIVTKDKFQAERDKHENACHPWLLQMFVYCPHAETSSAFAKFIVTCVKVLRIKQSASDNETCDKVSLLVQTLLTMLEKILPDDVGRSDGYKLVSMVLYQIAVLGVQERQFMYKLGAIYRLVCSILSANPSANRIPDTHLRFAVDLISLLVNGICNPEVQDIQSNNEDSYVNVRAQYLENQQAFLNRVFLEEAIVISTAEISAAIHHTCVLVGAKETVKVVEFLLEKIVDCTSYNGGTNLHYRPFFKVLTEIFLSTSMKNTLRDLSPLLTQLMNKAYVLSTRRGPNDAEFVYAVCKLSHRIATASNTGHNVVMHIREIWRDIGLKFNNAKRPSIRPPVQQQENPVITVNK